MERGGVGGRVSYSVEATELVAGHGDDDRDELPADRPVPDQLGNRHHLQVVLRVALRVHLLQLLGHVRLPQETPEG